MIKLGINYSELKAMREKLARNIKFGYVAAMTWAVRETKEDIVAGLTMFFTIRNNYVKGGFRSTQANVNDAVPEAEVGAIKPREGKSFMRQHAIGGERDIGEVAAIPLYARRQKRMQTRKPVWPGSIIAKDGSGLEKRWIDGEGATKKAKRNAATLQDAPRQKNRYFIARIKGRDFLVQRLSKGRSTKLRFWYMFVKQVHIKKDWPFEQYVRTAEHHFHQRIKQSLHTNVG